MRKSLLLINCGLLSALALFQGYARERVKIIGANTGYFYEEGKPSCTISNQLFEGVNCGKRLNDIIFFEQFMYSSIKSSNIYFGNRLQWSYAQFGLASPTNLPVIWDPGSSFSVGNEDKLFNAFLSKKFEYMILIKSDLGCYPAPQQSAIMSNYWSITLQPKNTPASNYLAHAFDELELFKHK